MSDGPPASPRIFSLMSDGCQGPSDISLCPTVSKAAVGHNGAVGFVLFSGSERTERVLYFFDIEKLFR
jgi:hypothetical protein